MELNERLNYESLLELCREYKEDIKARKKLPGVLGNRKVRYIDQEGLLATRNSAISILRRWAS